MTTNLSNDWAWFDFRFQWIKDVNSWIYNVIKERTAKSKLKIAFFFSLIFFIVVGYEFSTQMEVIWEGKKISSSEIHLDW